jgi:hypothetical protein
LPTFAHVCAVWRSVPAVGQVRHCRHRPNTGQRGGHRYYRNWLDKEGCGNTHQYRHSLFRVTDFLKKELTMKIEKRKLSKMPPYESNPPQNDVPVNAVVASVKEFGSRRPIGVDKRTDEEQRGLECRVCRCKRFRVIYTRPRSGGGLLRRRECRHCGSRITTCEREIG